MIGTNPFVEWVQVRFFLRLPPVELVTDLPRNISDSSPYYIRQCVVIRFNTRDRLISHDIPPLIDAWRIAVRPVQARPASEAGRGSLPISPAALTPARHGQGGARLANPAARVTIGHVQPMERRKMPTAPPAAIVVEFPLFAFSHCRDVVAGVTRAGGFGVFGAAGCSPEELEIELAWIDAHVDGKPYGVDLLIPENLTVRTQRGMTRGDLAASIPPTHRSFVDDLLRRRGIDPSRRLENYSKDDPDRPPPYQFETGEQLMDVAFRHGTKLIVNALGVPPTSMLERARAFGIPCAALIGAREHAVRQIEAGSIC
jgi:hypothetical protein